MTTYNAATVSDAAIAYENAITLQQGRALRDNPLAIGEGAVDAPKVQSAALNIAVITSAGTLTGLGRVATMLCMASAQQTGEGTSNVRYRRSADGGATWTGYSTAVSMVVSTGDIKSYTSVASVQITMGPTYNAIEFARTGGGAFFAIGIKGVSP